MPNQDQLDQIQLGQEFGRLFTSLLHYTCTLISYYLISLLMILNRFANFTQTTPVLVDALRDKKIVEIAAGYACTAAVTG